MKLHDFALRLRAGAGSFSREHNVGRRWSKAEPQPKDPQPIGPAPLYGIIAPWCEADVIGSTVANAFAQGCERVLIVDNDSPDDTVAEAKAAGAEIALVYHTDYYDEPLRISLVREVIESTSRESGADHVWWLTSDADEFVHGPGGLTVREYLDQLDRRFRVVGSRVFNHYPSDRPAHVRGRHPLDYQPLCQEVRLAWCSLWHWKHPLFRWDRFGTQLGPDRGFHRIARCGERLTEPREPIYLHHFQYRDCEATYARMRRLCEASEGGDGAPTRIARDTERLGGAGQSWRFTVLDHVYAAEWDQVPLRTTNDRVALGLDLRRWADQVPPEDAAVKRWYDS